MAGKAICKESIRKNTIADMKKLGVYKAEYNAIIDIYSELREQYERITKEFKDSGYKFQLLTADGGKKKAPIVATLESLRKDILLYTDRLCLTPKALSEKRTNENKKKKLSTLGKALAEIE